MDDHLEFVNTQKLRGMANVETCTRCVLKCPQCARKRLLAPRDSNDYTEIKHRISLGFDLPIADAEKLLKFFDQGIILCGSISDPIYWPNLLDFLALTKQYPNKRVSIHTAANQKT